MALTSEAVIECGSADGGAGARYGSAAGSGRERPSMAYASWSFDASLKAIAEAESESGVLVLLSKPEAADDLLHSGTLTA